MKSASSIWMAVLTFTAVLLAVVLLGGNTPAAEAAMINAQDDYSLITSGVAGGDEALFIVDKTSQKIVVYRVQGTEIIPVTGATLR